MVFFSEASSCIAAAASSLSSPTLPIVVDLSSDDNDDIITTKNELSSSLTRQSFLYSKSKEIFVKLISKEKNLQSLPKKVLIQPHSSSLDIQLLIRQVLQIPFNVKFYLEDVHHGFNVAWDKTIHGETYTVRISTQHHQVLKEEDKQGNEIQTLDTTTTSSPFLSSSSSSSIYVPSLFSKYESTLKEKEEEIHFPLKKRQCIKWTKIKTEKNIEDALSISEFHSINRYEEKLKHSLYKTTNNEELTQEEECSVIVHVADSDLENAFIQHHNNNNPSSSFNLYPQKNTLTTNESERTSTVMETDISHTQSEEDNNNNNNPIGLNEWETALLSLGQDLSTPNSRLMHPDIPRWIYPFQHLIESQLDSKKNLKEKSFYDDNSSKNTSIEPHSMRIYKRVHWLNVGKDHPDFLAESETLASVSLPNINENLEIRLPFEVLEKGYISNPQFETLIYASQRFQTTLSDGKQGGYVLGDGTGCGKGRIIAASIWHLWNLGYRRHIWVSVSSDLIQDAIRDFQNIGANHIPVIDLGGLKSISLLSKQGQTELSQRALRINKDWANNKYWRNEGVLFVTYTLLSRSATSSSPSFLSKKDKSKSSSIIQSSSSSSCSTVSQKLQTTTTNAPKILSRFEQLIEWMSESPSLNDQLKATKQKRFKMPLKLTETCQDWQLQAWNYQPDEIMTGGLLCFDEAHKAKNLVTTGTEERVAHKGTATGIVVQKLQDMLPHCPILYASATGASELRHLAYMSRLNLWGSNTAFAGFQAFRDAVEKGSITAMECLAMDLKGAGMYSCRTLSFTGVTFSTVNVPSNSEFIHMYNSVTNILTSIYGYMTEALESCTNKTLLTAKSAALKAGFWSAEQRIFKQLLVSQKIQRAVELAQEAIKKGHQVVISLWGTGEARTADKIREIQQKDMMMSLGGISPVSEDTDEGCHENKKARKCKNNNNNICTLTALDDFLSPPKLVLEKFISEKLTSLDNVSKTEIAKLKLQLENIAFPNNPIDDLINKLGGPEHVAELSGRTKRLVWDDDGRRLRYVSRDTGASPDLYTEKKNCDNNMNSADEKGIMGLNSINLKEQQLFQKGSKKVAIITEAASAGISLHCDNQLKNPTPREMICIELPWAADRAIQQFGRVHRSNQRYPPTYHFLVSDIGGEKRFVACIAKRLKTLGAITRGDRNAAFGNEGTTTLSSEKKENNDDDDDDNKKDFKRHDSNDNTLLMKNNFFAKIKQEQRTTLIQDNHTLKPPQQPFFEPSFRLDAYSKIGLQARTVLFKWIYYYAADILNSINNTPNFRISDPPVVTSLPLAVTDGRYESNETFAIAMVLYFRERGLLETNANDKHLVYDRLANDNKSKDMDRFLNRMLMLPINVQNELMEFYTLIYNELLEIAEANGNYDKGIHNINKSTFGIGYNVSVASKTLVYSNPTTGGTPTYHYHLIVDRGISWDTSQKLLHRHERTVQDNSDNINGYYWLPERSIISGPRSSRHRCVALVIQRHQPCINSQSCQTVPRVWIIRPHLGVLTLLGGEIATTRSIEQQNWKKIRWDGECEIAEQEWTFQYETSKSLCMHEQSWGHCAKKERCRVGRRFQNEHLLCGNIFTLWTRLERWFETVTLLPDANAETTAGGAETSQYTQDKGQPSQRRLCLVRAELDNNHAPLIGVRIPENRVSIIQRNLRLLSTETRDKDPLLQQITQITAQSKLFDPSFYIKFLNFVVDSIYKSSCWSPAQYLTLGEVYGIAMERLDTFQQPLQKEKNAMVLPRWSDEELETVSLAFPANASGLDSFDVFLRQGSLELGLERNFDSNHGEPLYKFSSIMQELTSNDLTKRSATYQALLRQIEWYRYRLYHLEAQRNDRIKSLTESYRCDITKNSYNDSKLKIGSKEFVMLTPPSTSNFGTIQKGVSASSSHTTVHETSYRNDKAKEDYCQSSSNPSLTIIADKKIETQQKSDISGCRNKEALSSLYLKKQVHNDDDTIKVIDQNSLSMYTEIDNESILNQSETSSYLLQTDDHTIITRQNKPLIQTRQNQIYLDLDVSSSSDDENDDDKT